MATSASSRFKLFLLNWACIFPLVVILNAVVGWLLARWHLPEWFLTAIVAGLLTFLIIYYISPWLERTFQPWLGQS